MKNKKNARLLCIMLTAAMLVQPMNVSAAGLMPGRGGRLAGEPGINRSNRSAGRGFNGRC